MNSTIVTYLVVIRETVFRDAKSTIVSAVTCAFSWVGEKLASRTQNVEGDLQKERCRRQYRTGSQEGFNKLPVIVICVVVILSE
jgi:hypothetical protein